MRKSYESLSHYARNDVISLRSLLRLKTKRDHFLHTLPFSRGVDTPLPLQSGVRRKSPYVWEFWGVFLVISHSELLRFVLRYDRSFLTVQSIYLARKVYKKIYLSETALNGLINKSSR